MPVHLRLTGVSFAYPRSAPLFDGVHLSLAPGWYGLVGENGAGKSTLLSLLAGSIAPTDGERWLDPPDATLVVCAPAIEAAGDDVRRLATRSDRLAIRLRASLALSLDGLDRWPTLSPGERRRWQLGAALAAEPDVLLVDEPTNHLDEGARSIVERALRAHRGIGIVVSHDRALLEGLTTRTIRVAHGTVRVWEGAYEEAKSAWEAEAEALASDRSLRRDAVRAARQLLGDARREHAAAERNRSTGRRMRDASDSDARGGLATQMARWGEAKRGRDVHLARERLAGAERSLEEAPTPARDRGRSVSLGHARTGGPIVLSIDADVLRAGEHRVLEDVHLVLRRDDRVHLAGPNGAGKTTLVHALLGVVPPERVLFLPQELDPTETSRAIASVRALAPGDRGRAMSLVAALGADPDRIVRTGTTSPGEARKLLLALGLGRRVPAIVLDEPTNHLDLPSIERLEHALEGYDGALLVVTHDRALAARLTTTEWRIEDGRVAIRSTREVAA